MTIDQLKHFTAAARERNLSRAAEQLYISHSAISRSISSLEKELGVRLLDRTSRSVTPTMAGELLYMRATKLLHEFDMIRIDVSELGKAKKGLLRFSSAIPYNENIMRKVQMFKSHNDDVELVFRSTTPFRAISDLMDGRCDICITYSFAGSPMVPNIGRIPLEEGSFVLVTSVENELSKRKSIRFSELQNILEESNSAPPIIPGLKQHTPPAIDEAMRREISIEDIFFSVRMNMENAIVPEHSTSNLDSRCVSIPLTGKPDEINYRIYMYYDAVNPNPALNEFLEL